MLCFMRTLCASSTAMTLPEVKPDYRYKPMPMLNKTHAILASTKVQEKSMIVRLPDAKVAALK